MGLKHLFPSASKIIVIGNQKSGTSAIASLLARATGLSSGVDNPNLWGDGYVRVRSGIHGLKKSIKANAKFFANRIVKEPNLTFVYPELRLIYPKAKFVLVVRDPVTNYRSFCDWLSIGYNKGDIKAAQLYPDLPPAKRTVLDDEQLYGASPQDLSFLETYARRWNAALFPYFMSPSSVVVIRYEDFLLDKLQSTTNLAKSLGLHVKNDISDIVDKQFQPKGNSKAIISESLAAKIHLLCKQGCGAFSYGS